MNLLTIAQSKSLKNQKAEQKLVKALNSLEKKASNTFLKQAIIFQLQDLVENNELITLDKS